MNELSKFLVEQILLEGENPIEKTVVIYVGRFQPFHKGHYATYQHLVKKFGKDNVFIGTSDKVEKPKSPFNFKEKVKIMTTMFGVPSNKIHQVKNPYAPTEILSKFDENTTAFITVVGEKDKNRLGGKYFQPYKGEPTEGYKDRGYVYASPSQANAISGTDVRNGLSVGSDDQKENFFTNRAYGKFNKTIFKMITDKLNEGIIEIPKERIEEWLINESSTLTDGQVDDGPNFFFPNYDVFSRISTKRAAKIGWDVVNMITTKELEDYYNHPNYPNGPTKSVTFFPAGVIGAKTPNNQVDIYSSGAYSQWFKHATRKASLVGYELVMTSRAKEQLAKEKSQSGGEAKGDKKLQDEFEKSLNEAITLPVEIGDTLLMGKFKNKKVVVKTIGKDEHGMPTINGKKVVTFRLVKEGKQVFFEDEKEDEKYTHIGYGKYKEKGKEKDSNSPIFKKDDSGKYTQVDGGNASSAEDKPKQNIFSKDSGYNNSLPDNDPAKKSKPKQDDWTKGKDGWEILDDDRAKVEKIRDYSDKEYEEETGEYFENDVTQKVAPNAFKDENDMIQKMKAAKPIFLSSEDMQNMSNTDVGDILAASEEGGKDAMLALGKERAQEYGKDWDRLEKGIASNSEVPAPMALRDKNGNLHLLAGNTRMMSFTASGKKLPVKVIDYDGEFNYEEDNQDSDETQPSEPIKTKKAPKIKTPTSVVTKKIKTGIKKLSQEEKKYFGKLLKNQDEVKRSFTEKLKDKVSGAGKAIKDGLKHEVHLFKSAGKTIGQLASGKTKFKDLQPEQKKELKSVGIKILMTGAVAASSGVGGGIAGVGKLAGHTLAELVPHVVGETLLKGIARAAIFADEEQEFEANLNKYAEALIKGLEDIEITPEMMANIIDKHTGNSENSVNEDVNTIAGTSIKCEKCNHSWDIEVSDVHPYLCHSCGWDSQQQEYDFDEFDSWQEKMGLLDEASGSFKGGKLRPYQLVRRKFALAGKGPEIARKKKRTMMRRKPLSKLVKIAYKMAYRKVYDDFAKKLFPDTPKSELTLQQTKVVHRNVLRKKRRVLKRAKFLYLPMLRAKEAEKFGQESTLKNEMSMAQLKGVEKYAEKQLSPEDIEFTKHFFDRVNDPRNGKEISDAELTGFFKRLSKHKKQFKDFLEKYKQIVVKDKRYDINIPFVKTANQIIAKTVMRKDDFKTSSPTFAFEQLAKGMSLRDISDKHGVSFEDIKKEAKKGVKVEMEHTEDVNVAYDIAKDHLFEDPKYYTKLSTIEESLITEGGAYGHMNHPFDTEINLTFGDLKDIVNRALEGNLELTREKTDGQALAISWVGGRLVAARNKGHLKNKGANALDIKGVADKFAGRGELEKAYNFAMEDLSKAIKALSEKQREKIFKGGACFMNLEVIYPTSVNVIPYGQALLVFHGTMEYNEEGEAIGENQEAARVLAGMIKQVNKDVQDNYTIQGPPVIQLPKNQNLSSQKPKFISKISKLQSEFGLKDTDGVAEYHQEWWKKWISKNSPSTLDNKTLMGLVKRWAFFDKGFRIDNKNISDEKTLIWAKKIDSQDQQKISKDNLMKFENIFLGVGAEVLQFTSSVLTVNPDKAVRDIKNRIDQTIKDVQKSGDPKKIEKLKLELKRLNSIGGPDKIVPNEGIVFVYKGNTFKLTGTFASVNQLLGIFF